MFDGGVVTMLLVAGRATFNAAADNQPVANPGVYIMRYR